MVSRGVLPSTELSSHTDAASKRLLCRVKNMRAGEDSRNYPIKYPLFINEEIEYGICEDKSDTTSRLWKRRWQMSSTLHLLHALCHNLWNRYLTAENSEMQTHEFMFWVLSHTVIFNICFSFTLLKVLLEWLSFSIWTDDYSQIKYKITTSTLFCLVGGQVLCYQCSDSSILFSFLMCFGISWILMHRSNFHLKKKTLFGFSDFSFADYKT